MRCGKPAIDDYGVCFPELDGAPFICSRCVYRVLMTKTTVWMPETVPEWRAK